MRIGWLSTGRDQAAYNLLSDIVGRARADGIALDIATVFCDREPGESPESDEFLGLVGRLGIPAVSLSSAESWRAAVEAGVERTVWRDEYHRAVMDLLEPCDLDVMVMAGYMLIVSPAMCRRYALLNLHPALPGGPAGTWQEVVWRLLEDESVETGAMMHLATAELDRGPVISYFRFSIEGGRWARLWAQFREKRAQRGVAGIAADEGEGEPLFAQIRQWGEVREIPLLYRTLCQFSEGRLSTSCGAVFAEAVRLPLDLTDQVEAEVARL